MVRPYRHVYDNIIVKHIITTSMRVAYESRRGQWKMDNGTSFVSVPQSFSNLYHAIQKCGYITVSRTTVQKHLNEMVKKDILRKYPNNGSGWQPNNVDRRYNQTLYSVWRVGIPSHWEEALQPC